MCVYLNIYVYYIYMYIYMCRETSTDKSLSPREPRTQMKGKEGVHPLKSRNYGTIFPVPPGSQQQRERSLQITKNKRTYGGAGSGVRVTGMGAGSVWASKTYCDPALKPTDHCRGGDRADCHAADLRDAQPQLGSPAPGPAQQIAPVGPTRGATEETAFE